MAPPFTRSPLHRESSCQGTGPKPRSRIAINGQIRGAVVFTRTSMKHVFIIASGPSARNSMGHMAGDIRAVQKSHRAQVIVVNNAWELYPEADYLVAADAAWWRTYGSTVKHLDCALLTTQRATAEQNGIEWMPVESGAGLPSDRMHLRGESNSGMLAISLAAGLLRARSIYLIGFDNQAINGEDHFHGNHPAAIRKVMPYQYWDGEYKAIARDALERGIDIWNLSRSSAIEYFERLGLGESLSLIAKIWSAPHGHEES